MNLDVPNIGDFLWVGNDICHEVRQVSGITSEKIYFSNGTDVRLDQQNDCYGYIYTSDPSFYRQVAGDSITLSNPDPKLIKDGILEATIKFIVSPDTSSNFPFSQAEFALQDIDGLQRFPVPGISPLVTEVLPAPQPPPVPERAQGERDLLPDEEKPVVLDTGSPRRELLLD